MSQHGFVVGKGTDMPKLQAAAQKILAIPNVKAVHIVSGPYSMVAYFDGADVRVIVREFMKQGLHGIETWLGLESYPPHESG